jgi:phosphoglycolate phosphatase
MNAALTAFGKEPWTLEESRTRIRQSLRDSFPLLFGDDWLVARDVFYDHFGANHLHHLRPLSGASRLLEALADQGVYLGVVSNKMGPALRKEAAHLRWDGFFGAVVGATDAAADKPDIAPVRMALAPSGLSAGPDVWFVGDADIDMECAHRSRCVPILVGDTPMADASLATFPPAYRFDDCDALYDLVMQADDTISSKVS